MRFSIMLARLTLILLSLNQIGQSQFEFANFLQHNIITETKYFRIQTI